jgi:pimeloyl-[acyl-carrier protein] methyl ester esterase
MSVHIETSGAGSGLVLIHGWGMHGGVWQPVVDALARDHRLHVVDLPGFGRSPALAASTLEAWVDVLSAALPTRVSVCGWSLGGQVALRWALARPDQVERLVLVSSTPRFVNTQDWRHGMDATVFLQFAAQVQRDYHGTLSRFLALQAQGGEEGREVLRQLRTQFFRLPAPAPEALQAGLDILLQTDLRAELAALAVPTLVLHGGRDQLVPPAAGRWLAETLPRARAEICATASHAPFLSHPEWFTACLGGFLDA